MHSVAGSSPATPTAMACSSAVERLTVNQVVASSILAGPASPCSSAVEHLVYTEIVGGSIPSGGIPLINLKQVKLIFYQPRND